MPNNADLLTLSGPQVHPLLEPDAVILAVREAFILHSERQGRLFPVVRERLETGGVFGIKSGDVQSQGLLGFKAAGFWPPNRARGGEPHQATIMLFDPATGRPTCLIDGNAITTARTGAAGVLGLQQLARHNSTKLCIFGTGVQASIQLSLALAKMPGISDVQYLTFDANPDSTFEASFASKVNLVHATEPNAAVAASDIVITATPGGGSLFDIDAVRPGTHINAVGTDTKGKRELPPGLLSRAHVVVDDLDQSRQIGEGQWYDDIEVTEIGDLITKKTSFDRSPEDITVFDMTGLALQDLTVARMLQQRAIEGSCGTRIAWPW